MLHVHGMLKGLLSIKKVDINEYKMVIENGRVEFTRSNVFVYQEINMN